MKLHILIQFFFQFAKQKQAELEDVQGKVFEGSDDPVKRRKITKVNLIFKNG